MNPKHPFKWRHFQSDIILLCVRWYLRYLTSVPQSGGDDAGEGANGRSYDSVSVNPGLRS